MSRIFTKLKELPVSVIPKAKESPNLLIPGIIIILAAVFILGNLSSNVGTIKNSIFLSMDANMQQQQNQIIVLNKKILAIQAANNSQLNKASLDAKHMETVLQSNIHTLNTRIKELQEDQIKNSF